MESGMELDDDAVEFELNLILSRLLKNVLNRMIVSNNSISQHLGNIIV